MKTTTISTTIDKAEFMRALRNLTINDPRFDPEPWSLFDAQVFDQAASLIRREIAADAPEKVSRGDLLA